MSYTYLLYDVADCVATITLNRPDVLNALNKEVHIELDHAMDQALADPEVNSILLAGAGKSFCAGFDLKESGEASMGPVWDQWVTLQDQRKETLKMWDSPKPIVSAVQGYCFGGGMALANNADLVIAAEDAVFGETEIRFSLMPQPATVWLVGLRRAKELLMLGERFSAAEAYRIGLVNRVVPSDQLGAEARKIAVKLARMPAETMRLAKRVLNKAVDIQGFREMGDWGWDLFLLSKLMVTKNRAEFNRIVQEKGLREAYRWMNERHGDV